MSRILVVDDEFDIAQAIKGILEDEGYQVDICGDGRYALGCLQETATPNRPSLVLLDMVMPYMGGLELLRRLRSDDRLKDIPIVLMNNSDLRLKESEVRCDGFLRKPFDLRSLMEAVQRYSEQKS